MGVSEKDIMKSKLAAQDGATLLSDPVKAILSDPNQVNKYGQSDYPIGNRLVPYGTPLHVTELFLRLLKIVFAEFPEDYPYRYIENDYDNTGILFDVALNKESEIFGKKPLVIVTRGSQNTTPINIGDLAHAHIPTNFKAGSNTYVGQLNFHVLSKTKAEVEIISQHIFGLLMLCRTWMPKMLNIHMVQSIMLSEVTKMEDDDTVFFTQGSFSYVGQYIWTQQTDDPILKSIVISIDRLLN